MQSTPNLRDNDPHDVFVIEPDVSLAARADKAPLDLLYDVLSRPSAPDSAPAPVRPNPELRIAPDFSIGATVPVDAAVRAHAIDDDIQLGEPEISTHQPATGRFARRAVMGLFALVSATGAAAWQHYGDDAQAMLTRYAPTFSLASTQKPATAELPAAAAVQAQATADNAALADQTQTIQSMAHDLASMGQQITELKATVEQLKASQQAAATPARTEAKLVEAKPAEPVLTRPKIVPPPTHSTVATLARRAKQSFPYAPIGPAPPPQTTAAPVQIAPPVQAAEDGGPVVRPPMPLH